MKTCSSSTAQRGLARLFACLMLSLAVLPLCASSTQRSLSQSGYDIPNSGAVSLEFVLGGHGVAWETLFHVSLLHGFVPE